MRAPVRFLFSYNGNVPNARACDVSYCDSDGITHSVEVVASSLYEAAAMALHRFQQATLATAEPGPASRLTVTVKGPAERHQLTVARLQAWLEKRRQESERADAKEPFARAAREVMPTVKPRPTN